MNEILMQAQGSVILKLVIIVIILDTIFGVLRAAKEKKFNSCFGINGAIRKVAMVISMIFLLIIDCMININLIAFIPSSSERIFRFK